ncbi:MAG: HAD-IA family hydrolase [Prolixibacteraceae bacterium]|nr:HAD-IA family hydrolase [Prolixibacteraceae bacterium]
MALTVYPGVKALIFDLDGTLSDSLPVHFTNWNKIGGEMGFVFTERQLYEMTGSPTIDFAKRIIDENHLQISPEELVVLKQEAFRNSIDKIKPIDEVIDVVRNYYGRLPLSVGTGASRRSATLQLEALCLAQYFDAVVTADDVVRHKPYPETFLRCAQMMKTAPSDCQVFEDGELGISAAKHAGMCYLDVRFYISSGKWEHS